MPVPSSGQLRLRADINQEVNGNDTDDNVSLGTLADDAGFDTPPDEMSEFYGYTAITPPTMSGSISTSNITDVQITAVAPAVYNTDGLNIKRGFYFGTSTTATSNTFYDEGDTTGSGINFSRQFTGLSGGTTYYIWGVVRDTVSPARYTEILTPMKTQATLATLNYSTHNLGQITLATYNGSDTSSSYGRFKNYYNHGYYGYTLTQNYTKYNGAWGGYTYQYHTATIKHRSGVNTNQRYYHEPYTVSSDETQTNVMFPSSISGTNYDRVLRASTLSVTGSGYSVNEYPNVNSTIKTNNAVRVIAYGGNYWTGYAQFYG